MKLRSALILLVITIFSQLNAQERCGTVELEESLNRQFPNKHNEERFEKWLQAKRNSYKQVKEKVQQVHKIPVVFHIVHNGEPEGVGVNISTERIIEQIQILNEDFRRTNADASETPAVFLDVAADSEIEFVLARQDPEGLPSDGITRTQGALTLFEMRDDELLKSHNFWPSEDYMNIWVTDLKGFLGWAKFPAYNSEGLENDFSIDRLIDGVVIDYNYIGVNPETGGSFESYGRTVTHEIGHYLGLRHIWGDGGCSADDYCDDTPFAGASNKGCPSDPVSCGSRDMFENYMDYTDDACMNLFTTCQKERMRIVLENAPRRRSLLTSKGLNEPQVFGLDLGIREIIKPPSFASCDESYLPQVEIRNYGENFIESFTISCTINGELHAEITQSISLAPLDLYTLIFPETTLSLNTENSIEFRVVEVNESSDQNNDNNNRLLQFWIQDKETLPLSLDFEEDINWLQVGFPGKTELWTKRTATNNSVENQTYHLPYYNVSSSTFGNFDYLISPPIDLSVFSSTSLEFAYAYAPRPNAFTEGLIVAISTDCGLTFPKENYLFEKYGPNLGTTASLDQEFSPISSNDWETVSLDLQKFNDQENIRIAFIGVNGNGNNLYLDDITVAPKNLLDYDVGVGEVKHISLISCLADFAPFIEVKNVGALPVTSLLINYRTNSNTAFEQVAYNDLNIPSGGKYTVVLPDDVIDENSDILEFELIDPNGVPDLNSVDNHFSQNVLIDNSEESIPTRENFEEEISWKFVSTSGTHDWEIFDSLGYNSIYARNFEHEVLGKENWLVSPVLNLDDYDEASMSFRVSYAQKLNIVDGLRVMLSTDCGLTWETTLFNRQGDAISNLSSNVAWFPQSESDWENIYINLTPYITNFVKDIRLAIVSTNGGGNNLFIDDIQIFSSAIPNPVITEENLVVYPNPAEDELNLALNLDDKREIDIIITDFMGKAVYTAHLQNALNQVISIDVSQYSGLYLVSIISGDQKVTKTAVIR